MNSARHPAWRLTAAALWATGLVLAALAAGRLPTVGSDVAVLLPLAAVAGSTWIAGEPAALVATVLATAGVFAQPHGTSHSPLHGGPALLFAVAASSAAWLIVRHRRTAALSRRVEARHRMITDFMPDAVLIHREGIITYANGAAADLFGAQHQSDLIGRPVLDLVPPDQRATVGDRLRDVQAGRRPPTHESQAIGLDGRELLVAVRATRLPDDGSVLVTFRDVAWRHEAETQMRRSAEMMRALIDSSPVAIVALTRDGIVTTWNPAAERTFGWTADEVLGQAYPLAQGTHDDSFATSFAAALEGRATTFQTIRQRRDGDPLSVIVSTAPVLDRDGRVERVIALLVDTTEQRRLESEIRQSQKMEAIGRLAGGVAHDFNNLLTAMIGFAEIAIDDLPAGAPGRGEVEQIKSAAERAAGLTHQLLAFSRKQMLQPIVVDVNAQVLADERFLRRIIGEDIRIIVSPSPHPAFVLADPVQLDQVVMNLAINARDAMPSGGVLEIEVRRVRMDEGHRRHGVEMKPGEYVRIAITDTGQGMSPEVQQRLFEPFFTTKGLGKGTGLGLATVFGIVKQSGGYIWVYSEVGAGTAMKVYLPAVERDATAIEPVEPAREQTGVATQKVLVVDDEVSVAEFASRVLAREGYTVLVASGPSQAEKIAAETSVDLLVTDIVMPGVSGTALADALRATYPGIRVLYMSGYAEGDSVHHATRSPDVRFIEKPFAAEALVGAVRDVLRGAVN